MVYGEQGPIGNVDLVKQLNGAAVYRLIDQHGPISRIQIAELSQLAPASITKITRQLLDRGLIKEVDQQASTGGRRATSIICENRPFHTIAVRLGLRDTTLALYDLSGKKLAETRYAIAEQTQEALEGALVHSLKRFIADQQHRLRQLIAISVVLPGLMDTEQGIVHYMPDIAITQWHLAANLQRQFNLACFIGHDIRSLALAEHYFGTTQDCADSLLVRVHRGTGAGIIVNGQIFLGSRGNVGEIGHLQLDPLGERCHCGNFGCLETVAANSAIERRVQYLLQQGYPSLLTTFPCGTSPAIKDICQAAYQGDTLAKNVIEQVGHHLGNVLAIAINLFNPQKVVIAGEITAASDLLLPAIQACINNQALKDFRQDLPVVISTLEHTSAIGAFALVKQAMHNGVLLQQLLENSVSHPRVTL